MEPSRNKSTQVQNNGTNVVFLRIRLFVKAYKVSSAVISRPIFEEIC